MYNKEILGIRFLIHHYNLILKKKKILKCTHWSPNIKSIIILSWRRKDLARNVE